MAGDDERFETSSLFRFLSSVSNQFSISFQNQHYFLPDFNISFLIAEGDTGSASGPTEAFLSLLRVASKLPSAVKTDAVPMRGRE